MAISKSGSFATSIKNLTTVAYRALYTISNNLGNSRYKPTLLLKLFDTLIKPIALYGSEMWGGFGNKHADLNAVMMQFDKPFEKLHLRITKLALKVSNKAPNIACLAELGRYPLVTRVLSSVLKFNTRLVNANTGSLLSKAYLSQLKLPSNSGNTHTFVDFCSSLFNSLNVNYHVQADHKSKSSQIATKNRRCVS